ncbi:MAG TPA: HAMP domain-containing sensor histidine kinase, partial [Ilumatobacteraceae bacterium]|nr:HAMP domain-containing sensor histidine kinase [Ilumatobacteraceae bacterium]
MKPSLGRLTLRTRLVAGMGLIALVLVVVVVVITITTHDRLIRQVDARLRSISPASLVPLPTTGADATVTDETPDDVPDLTIGSVPNGGQGNRPFWGRERVSDAYEGWVDADGTLHTRFEPNAGGADYGAPDLSGVELPRRGSLLITTGSSTGAVTYRVLIQPAGPLLSVTAVPLDAVQSTITQLIWVQIGGVGVVLIVLGLVAWWVLRLGIRPIKEMTRTATRIADGDLSVRVPETAPGTESGDLAVALNAMLVHIGTALDERAASEERLRRFVADASHELRTPVTTIRHGGLARQDSLDDAMRRTEQEAARMGRLIEDMLTLAKFDEQRPLATHPVDMITVARDTVADARAAAPERTIELHVDVETAMVAGDADRLHQVLT